MKHIKHKRKQTGMSMLEVVVAMLIVGLGMAVSINMLQTSVRYNEEAEFRSIAVGKIEQIADHMRMNRLAALNGSYTYPAPADLVTVANADTWVLPPAPNLNCNANPSPNCTPQQFANASAQTDLFEWGADLRQSLPEGAANIVSVRNGQNNVLSEQYEVTIFWRYIQESDKDNRAANNFSSLSMLITL